MGAFSLATRPESGFESARFRQRKIPAGLRKTLTLLGGQADLLNGGLLLRKSINQDKRFYWDFQAKACLRLFEVMTSMSRKSAYASKAACVAVECGRKTVFKTERAS
jgi:hypothetical protein